MFPNQGGGRPVAPSYAREGTPVTVLRKGFFARGRPGAI
jgi:hypothetical protein